MYLTKYLLKHILDDTHVLLVNTLSGAIDIITQTELSDIELISKGMKPHNSELMGRLKKRGYIFSSEDEEKQAFETLRNIILRLEEEDPTIIAISPTYLCNFRCVYCYMGELTSTSARPLINPLIIFGSIQKIENFLRKRMNLKKKPDIAFIGGEPLFGSTKRDVTRIFKIGAAKGYKFRIITNGFLLDAFLNDFANHLKALKYVQVTVDGPQVVHDSRRPLINSRGTFRRITKNIQLALEAGIPIQLRTNVDSKNILFLPELANYIKKRGWLAYPGFKAYLAPVEDNSCLGIKNAMREDNVLETWLRMRIDDSMGEDLAVFDDSKLLGVTRAIETALRGSETKVLPRFRYCAATKGKLFVLGADGYIYLCLKGMGDVRATVGKFYPDFEIHEEKLNLWLSRDIGNINCSSCSIVAPLQGGGCAIEALRRTGNLHACSCQNAPAIIGNYFNIKNEEILNKYVRKDLTQDSSKGIR